MAIIKGGPLLATLVVLVLAFEAAQSIPFDERDLGSEEALWSLYERWRGHHAVPRDLGEARRRFDVFKESAMFVHEFNSKDAPAYKLALNRFADMTNQEFRAMYAGSRVRHHRLRRGIPGGGGGGFMHAQASPESVDWREKGAVTGVKNQGGSCVSDWAFSAVAAVEGMNWIRTGNLVSFSEQQLIDCSFDEGNVGCYGGQAYGAFEYIKNNRGIASDSDYPYRGESGSCERVSPSAAIDGYQDVEPNREDALKKAVASQPVSVNIDTTDPAFKLYSGGVFTGDCDTIPDHGVAIVGYGTTEDGIKYWIVKNSWGSEWGEEGYIRMEREVSNPRGICGIAMQASFPYKSSLNLINSSRPVTM